MPVQMARLNEPAAVPMENLESLKRKFIRQNRDIARANSAQSLRIRSLENEISKLLADNLGLREHILRLQNELDHGKAQRVASQANAIKSQLEAKLLEIGALLTNLGDGSAPKKPSPKAKTTRASLSKSPDQKNWKNICSLSEAVAGQEGRLPPILENKTYPRRTLELHELTAILAEQAANTTDSPEIGPPPVSQFVNEDPVKIDLPTRTRDDEEKDSSELDPALSINLEQRKKRRDSGSISEFKKSAARESSTEEKDSSASRKSGAKRKLSVRGDDEDTRSAQEEKDDSFSYIRSNAESKPDVGPLENAGHTAKDTGVSKGAMRLKASNGTTAISARKILAPKSVNNSPKKRSRPQVTDEVKAAKEDIMKAEAAKERLRNMAQDPLPVIAALQPVPDTIEIQPEPETPAALDLFSPQTSLPSTIRTESRDTPPPVDLGTEPEEHRPSRRARGSVSYAEPNLRDKMRRPTKELVDAVTREQARRTAVIKMEEATQPNDARIKAEPEAEDSWKNLPVQSTIPTEANSPLRGKAPPTTTPNGLVSYRKRRESSLHQGEADSQRVGSGTAISALLAGTRHTKVDAKEASSEDDKGAQKVLSPADIQEVQTSSPASEETRAKVEKEPRPQSRPSRRQSSVSNGMGKDPGASSDIELSRKSSSTLAPKRRTSTLGLKNSQQSEHLTSRRVASATGDVGADTRSDRISRRKSTLL
ncbi:shugoshin c terminal domain-containing protein [Phlyctema vagabunda]|uniref:Shugoshin c terminal domain-containing protein n=1 Tax=Phlyctema vagabunda TaxID=108571 RepID=A0ABR4PRA1_9HELO